MAVCVLLVPSLIERGVAQEVSPVDVREKVASAAGSYIVFDVPGADCSVLGFCVQPVGVDSQGTVAGIYNDGHHGHGFYRLANGTITTFDAPGAFCADAYSYCTEVTGISPTGIIAGWYYNGDAVADFVRSPSGTFAEFIPPNAISTAAFAVNSAGAVTGNYVDANYNQHGFVRDPSGNITSFDAPDAGIYGTSPTAINSQGEIVGTANYYTVAFLRGADGTIVDLHLPVGPPLLISAIDDAGRIVGSGFSQGGAVLGFIGDPEDGYTTFSLPGSTQTLTNGIDVNGTIVGNYQTTDSGPFLGFYRLRDGTFGYVDPPGSKQTYVTGIGPQGIITGPFSDASKVVHGFLRIPW